MQCGEGQFSAGGHFKELAYQFNGEMPLAHLPEESPRIEIFFGSPHPRTQWLRQNLLHTHGHAHRGASVHVVVIERMRMPDNTASNATPLLSACSMPDRKMEFMTLLSRNPILIALDISINKRL